MNLSTVQKRLFAWGLAKANDADIGKIKLNNHPIYDKFSELKQALLGDLSGKVLEIGAGTGANFAYYSKDINWIGIEPNPFMFVYLEQEAEKQGIKTLTLTKGAAENLPFDDNSIDAVVSTHVLCSVKDVTLSLQEIYRVLKPQGKFIFLEHIAAKSGTITHNIQTVINPAWQFLFDNCHVQRKPEQLLETVGFNHLTYNYFELPLPIVSPHVAGVAYKS